MPTVEPFDWTEAGHALVKAGESVNWDLNDLSAFAKRVQSIEYGLSAETEFAAILAWLGNCDLVHRLDQDFYSSHRGRKAGIPDLLAIFCRDGLRVPSLIEVKTCKANQLVLRTSDLDARLAYAQELNLPLFIAWKPRQLGFWILVDPVHVKPVRNKSILSFGDAYKNNWLSAVAGDFVITLLPNAGLFIESTLIRKTEVREDGFEGIYQVEDVGFRDLKGQPIRNIPGSILALLFSTMREQDEVAEDTITKSFVTVGGAIHAQQVLRSVIAMKSFDNSPIKWRHVAKDLASFLSRDTLSTDIRYYSAKLMLVNLVGFAKLVRCVHMEVLSWTARRFVA